MARKDTGQGKGGRKAAGRAKGTGTLERHGRTWRAVWVVNGTTYRKSTGTSVKEQAEKRLAEFVAPYRADIEAAKAAKAARAAKRDGCLGAAQNLADAAKVKRIEKGRLSVTINKAWDKFNASPARGTISESTARTYAGRWERFAEWLKEHRPSVEALADVDDALAEEYMADVKMHFSPKTFNDVRAMLFMVWKVLDEPAGLEGFNPWDTKRIKPLPKATHVRRELTLEELERVVEQLTGEMRTLFAIGIYSGLRLGDAATLEWGNVDLARGFIQCKPKKTQHHGTMVKIPLFPALASIFAETPKKMRRGPILPVLAAEYSQHPQYTSRRIQQVFEDAGITTQSDAAGRCRKAVDVGFHSLRHGFVSLCANHGVPLAVVQAIVGHTNTAMTQHYFHVSDEALKGAVAVLPDVFKPTLALPSHEVGTSDANATVETFEAISGNTMSAIVKTVKTIIRQLEDMTGKNWERHRDRTLELAKDVEKQLLAGGLT